MRCFTAALLLIYTSKARNARLTHLGLLLACRARVEEFVWRTIPEDADSIPAVDLEPHAHRAPDVGEAFLLLYWCFTAALLLLYCCFTAALLLLYSRR
jgi:hypothetical protein